MNNQAKEADEQKALVRWLKLMKITHFAPGNENLHSGIIRQWVKPASLAAKIIAMIENKLKAMGKRKGVNDLVVLLPGAKAIFIEMKRKKGGVVSQEQAEWRKEIKALGFEAHICHGFDEAMLIIKEQLNG
ncbi:MAG: VRR-NUC domain-containing protein [Methylobacter sp.]|nr:VRR-NUC domain-containing protein [Methylobacter sp.]